MPQHDAVEDRAGHRGLRRLFAVAFLADFQLYLIYTAMPFKALHLGAGPFELGLLAALSTGTYALLVGPFGRLSDRVSRTQLARFSCVGTILGCIGSTLAPEVRWMYLAAPFVGGSMSPFWPSVQAAVADRSATSRLERNLGRFNLSWTLGKASGFFLGGVIVATLGSAATFTVASCVAFALFFVLPGPTSPAREPAPASALTTPHEDPRAARFRRPAWVANGIAFGVGATLNHHYPRLIREFGWGPETFGLFLGLIYLTQAVTFVTLMWRPERWRFRRSPLILPQVLLLLAVLGLPFADRSRLLVSALVFGFGLGSCYSASIYYSLHAGIQRGRNAGVHEGMLGVGSMLVPFLGGLGARVLQAIWMPYAVAGAAVVLSLLVQEILFRLRLPGPGSA